MRKDLTGSVLQFFQTQKRRFYSGAIHQQIQGEINPFQDDHIIKTDEKQVSQKIPNFFSDARKEILQSEHHSRMKSYSLDRPEKQIYIQRIAQTQAKHRGSRIKSSAEQLKNVSEQKGLLDQQHNSASVKKLKYLHSLSVDQTVKQEIIKKKELSPPKELTNPENEERKVIDIPKIESIEQLNDSENNIKTPEAKQTQDNQINIFENVMLKQILQEVIQDSRNSVQKDVSPNGKQIQNKNKSSKQLVKEEKKSPSNRPLASKRKCVSQKQLSQDFHHFFTQNRDQTFEKGQTVIDPNNGLDKIKIASEQMQSKQNKQGIKHKPINYIQYAFTQMQKQKMEGNLEQAAFTPVEINSKKQQIYIQKTLSVAQILNNEKMQQKRELSQDTLLREEMNDSIISNISFNLLPSKIGEINISKDSNADLNQVSKSLQRNSTELSYLTQRSREMLQKKQLPQLQQKQKYKFVKIIQKSFGDDSVDIQSSSINSGRRTPSLTINRDSPIQKKRYPQVIDKENSSNMKVSQSYMSINDSIKTWNKLSTISLQKNLLGKLLKEQKQPHDESNNQPPFQPTIQKTYSFAQTKKIFDINKNLLELTQTLQKQEKKSYNE